MEPVRNIYMCLVHESQDCVIDLVRNLRYLDPASRIILYNGGTDPELFSHFPFEKYNAVIHPSPRPLKWGWLHDFAIDCMELALASYDFDLITVVDSDQLACGKNYSGYVSSAFHAHPDAGMFGQVASRILPDTRIDPAVTAYQEKDLWQPFLETLPNGKDAFLYWTFWPSTAFTAKAAADIVKLFRTNDQLKEILLETKIWASEEIILPTLAVALGYRIVENPCVYDFVKYRALYSGADIGQALENESSYWIHPVQRKINDRNRIAVRDYFGHYVPQKDPDELHGLIREIWQKTGNIEGWLDEDEAGSLVRSCSDRMRSVGDPVIVELGSYCGKATAAIALTAQKVNPFSRIVAVDDFTGRLGAADVRIDQFPPNEEKFLQTLHRTGISGSVEVIRSIPHRAGFESRIDLLLVDGMHDYASVARDFYAYEKQLHQDALILFHDYGGGFPGVTDFVNELLSSGGYEKTDLRSTLITLRKKPKTEVEKDAFPLVSCIMPTCNRAEFIAQAIDQFFRQDYPNKELIIIDDSSFSVESLVPHSDLIRYRYYDAKMDVGAKRNLACRMAKGEIIIHLDDDDYYASDWLTRQVHFLREQELEITGLSAPVFYDKSAGDVWQYIYPEKEKAWVYGATLCYTRKFWEANPFPSVNCGEDNLFVWNRNVKKILPHRATTSYIGRIHANNTSPKSTQGDRWSRVESQQARKIMEFHGLAQAGHL